MLRAPLSTQAARLLAITLESSSFIQRVQYRSFTPSSINNKGWLAYEPKYVRRHPAPTRIRRPLINGQTVAFHVNELKSASNYGIQFEIQRKPRNLYSNNINSNEQQQPYESDMIVVLDMDECLLHSRFLSSQQDAQMYAHQVKQQQSKDESETGKLPVDSFRVALHDGTLVHVHLRPGLYEFLEHVCSRYETHIFTAAMDIYANPVLDHIESKLGLQKDTDSKPKFAGRWYRQHCTLHRERNAYVKNLTNLWPLIQSSQNRPTNDSSALRRAVLVDNNPLSFLSNPENGILVSSFYSDSTDAELPAVLNVLQELEGMPDVRPFLSRKFALKDLLYTTPAVIADAA